MQCLQIVQKWLSARLECYITIIILYVYKMVLLHTQTKFVLNPSIDIDVHNHASYSVTPNRNTSIDNTIRTPPFII